MCYWTCFTVTPEVKFLIECLSVMLLNVVIITQTIIMIHFFQYRPTLPLQSMVLVLQSAQFSLLSVYSSEVYFFVSQKEFATYGFLRPRLRLHQALTKLLQCQIKTQQEVFQVTETVHLHHKAYARKTVSGMA